MPLIFLALFLFQSDVKKLVFVDTPEVRAATVQARTPVVLIVFDEFNTTSLMNARQNVDAERYPSFGRLARDATWYRNASTTFWLSEGAVPAILSGNPPKAGELPVLADHPRNLFTLLGGSYQMRVIETLTSLCPRSRCGNTRPEADAGGSARDERARVRRRHRLPARRAAGSIRRARAADRHVVGQLRPLAGRRARAGAA